MADIVALPDAREPLEDVVAAAEELLCLAKAGKIRGVGIAAVWYDNTTSCRVEGDRNSHAITAACADLLFRMTKQRFELTPGQMRDD